MKTAIRWLLEELKKEGRSDLIQGYNRQVKLYKKYLDIQAKRKDLASWEKELETIPSHSLLYGRAMAKIEKIKEDLARMEEESA